MASVDGGVTPGVPTMPPTWPLGATLGPSDEAGSSEPVGWALGGADGGVLGGVDGASLGGVDGASLGGADGGALGGVLGGDDGTASSS
jgi:hypothetical protein